MKKTLYIIFLIPLTLATLFTGIVATEGVYLYFSDDGVCGDIRSPEFLERRLELSSCTEEEKEASPYDCAKIKQAGRACGGAGIFYIIGFFASLIFIPLFLFYITWARKRVFN